MLHSKHITFSSGGTEATATTTQFTANRGVIYRVWITFPSGCKGLVKLRIYHEGHPFLPVEQDAYINGDDYVFEYPLFYEITGAPEVITIEGWNEDDTYNHTVDVQFLIIPKSWIVPVGAYEGIIAALKSLFTQKG